MKHNPRPAGKAATVSLLIAGLISGMGMTALAAPANAAPPQIDSGTWYSLENWRSRSAVDIEAASKNPDAFAIQKKSAKTTSQQFKFVSVGTGYYEILNRNSGLALSINTKTGSLATQVASTGASTQQFSIAAGSSGRIKLINRASGLALQVVDSSKLDGARLNQAKDTNATNQQFTLKTVDKVVTTPAPAPVTPAPKPTPVTPTPTPVTPTPVTPEPKPTTPVVTPTPTPVTPAPVTPEPKPTTPVVTPAPTPVTPTPVTPAPKPAPVTPAPTTGTEAKWPTPTSSQKVSTTIKVTGTFDGSMARYYGFAADSQSEGGAPMFELANGATIRNVILGSDPGDGIHCKGTCTIQNVWWENVGEDAATFKGTLASQTMTVNGGGARGAADKVFQHNGPGTFIIRNFQVEDFGKLYRSCGNCSKQFARTVIVENVVVKAPGKSLVGINPNLGDKATLSGITILGDPNRKIAICDEYKGVTSGEPTKLRSGPSAACGYTPNSITYK